MKSKRANSMINISIIKSNPSKPNTKYTCVPYTHRNRVASGAATKSTKKSGVTANLVKPGDVDTSGSDLEIRLSSPKRPDRLPLFTSYTFVYFL